jgi:hypothetical protein
MFMTTLVTTDFWSPWLSTLPMFLLSPLLSRLFGYEGYHVPLGRYGYANVPKVFNSAGISYLVRQ